MCAALDAHPSTPPFGVVPRTRKLDCSRMEPGCLNDKSRFNLSSDDNCVCVWRPYCKILNPAFALQRHTAPTAGVMVWGAIAYNTRSPLVLIRCTMTSCSHMCCHSCNGSQEPFPGGFLGNKKDENYQN
ncbi:uncharacterized protein TNCV_1450541 [Trichonephila clavipes]|nr:uncharacterized protein TNCV_1450541 [Trichonephila clavipes]